MLRVPSYDKPVVAQPCSDWGSCPGYILPSLLRLVPALGISSRPCSDWFPPRGYSPVPAPIGWCHRCRWEADGTRKGVKRYRRWEASL
eukprot:6063779-Pyramimonas_sp.AAC.2